MSVEEDNELRNLVAQTLENKGILPKIRAELRASVFLALEENISTREALLKNEELSAFIQIPGGILILNLVREFLEYFGLDFTLSVFDPETKYGKEYDGITRDKLIKELNISECRKKGPLLYEVIAKFLNDFKEESKTKLKSENKNIVSVNLNHCDVSFNGDGDVASPSSILNSTYVKYKGDGSSASPGTPHSNGENNSIDEELTSNESCTSERSSSNSNGKKNEESQNVTSYKENENSSVFKVMPENSTEFDLLKFTPVKEVKSKDKTIHEESEKKDNEEKTKVNSMTVLGDLPPLNGKTETKNKMNEIKAIIDQGLNLDNYEDDDFHSSASSRSSNGKDGVEEGSKYTVQSPEKSQELDYSERTVKTDIIEEENLDDELSDLINNHVSQENQLTLDETVSKLSDVADHLESL